MGHRSSAKNWLHALWQFHNFKQNRPGKLAKLLGISMVLHLIRHFHSILPWDNISGLEDVNNHQRAIKKQILEAQNLMLLTTLPLKKFIFRKAVLDTF